MRKGIDQSTFDELLLANAGDNIERAIKSASAVLEAVQEFIPEAALFYRVTHAADSLKNYFEEACTGFRRNGILFLVRKYTYPKTYYELHCDWSFLRYADNYSYGKAFDKQSEPNRIGVWLDNKSRGHITRHGLTYTFEIRQTAYSERISLDDRCHMLDDFLALSDNKLILKP